MKKFGKKACSLRFDFFPVFLPPVNMSQEDDMNDIFFSMIDAC